MSLDLFHGNIAGRRGHRRIKRRMKHHLDDVLILTEAYNVRPKAFLWCEEFGYVLRQPSARNFGSEGPDVAMLVRKGVEITDREIDRMAEDWFGPFNYPHSRKHPRVIQTLGLRKAGIDYRITGVHAPSGGPSGGVATRGKNADAWHEYSNHLWSVLNHSKHGAAVGDFNAKAADVRKYVNPQGVRVVMTSNVDGAAAVGCQIIAKRLRSPFGMHGWMTVRLTPKEN